MLGNKSFFISYSLAVVSVLAIATAKISNYDNYPAPENGTCYKRVPYDEAVIANLSQGLIKTESTTPPPGIETWITIIDCCDGYQRDEYTGNCEFYCEEGCFGGNCTGPNECTCKDGWQAVRGECKPTCRQRCPPNKYCFSPDVCACLFGFEEIDGYCRPVCQNNCRNGDCVAPADCRCHRGYVLNETKHCEPICESGCQHGLCTAPGVCSCDQGYVNQLYNPESCVPECPSECINGECITPNVCTCKDGYEQNDNGTCEAQCQESCPENGQCVAPDQCGCNPGFAMDIRNKSCIKLPKNVQTSQIYQNRGVFPSRNNQGDTYSREPNRVNGVNNAYNRQQNRPYGNVDRTTGSQGNIYGRTSDTNGQRDVYQTDNPYGYGQTEEPPGVVGLHGRVTTPYPQEGYAYGNYGNNREHNRPQGSYPTSTPYPTSGVREGIGGSTTYRTPENDPRYTSQGPVVHLESHPTPISPIRSNQGWNGRTNAGQPQYGSRANYPVNDSLAGPFAPETPQRFHTTQSPIHTDNPQQTARPYEPFDSQTQSSWNTNQNHNPYDRADPNGNRLSNSNPNQRQNPYDQRRPLQGVNRPYNPYAPTNAPEGQGVEDDHRRPSNPYEPHYTSQRPYNPYAPTTNPGETQGVKTSNGRSPYGSQGVYRMQNPYARHVPYDPQRASQGANQPHNAHPAQTPYNQQQPSQEASPYAPTNPHQTQGLKTAQRPSTDIYSRSSVMQNNPQSNVGFSYGVDHLNNVPQNGRPFNGQRPNNIPETIVLSDPYVHPGSSNIGGIIIIDGQQLPSVNQLGPICEEPCINSHCIGLNLCMCEIGFIPDPRNPDGNVCVPL